MIMDSKENNRSFWLYAPGERSKKWNEFYEIGEMAIEWDELGDLGRYTSKEEIEVALQEDADDGKRKYNSALACYEFAHEMNVGDIVIAKKGKRAYIGWGLITSPYFFNDEQSEYKHRRKVKWISNEEIAELKDGGIVTKTLTNITKYPDYVARLVNLLNIDMDYAPKNINYNVTKNKKSIVELNHPLNTIFYGPPGTGKTYNTVLRAAEIIKGHEISNYEEAQKIFKEHLHKQIEFITFHQNYSYEDFIQGLRPDVENGNGQLSFEKKDGIFKEIADRALANLKESSAAPEQTHKRQIFNSALEKLKDKITETEEKIMINNVAHFVTVEEDAFRYTGENWTVGGEKFYGFRMKFSDLFRFFEEDVTERKEVKELENISGLAKQHASYFIKVYEMIKALMPKIKEVTKVVQKQNYVIIIDEINRANISRVFGELITLIEPDKRYGNKMGMEVKLPSGDTFAVPSNLYIIGTMNTADKSIALLDIALRRRFEFEAMYPNYEVEGLVDGEILKKMNERIIKTKGHDFQIGHSYFMGTGMSLEDRMNKKVIPLLLEYFMNDEQEVTSILNAAGFEVQKDTFPLKVIAKNVDNVQNN